MLQFHTLDAAIARLDGSEYISPFQEKVLTLKDTLAGLSNINLTDVEMDGEDMNITMSIHGQVTRVTLGKDMTLKKVPGLQANQLVACSVLSPPNDLRAALLYISASAEAKSTFQLHLQQLKKKCIITQLSEYSAKLELQNGLEIDIVVDEYYPMNANGVQVTRIKSTSTMDEEEMVEPLRRTINKQCFRTITQVHDFFMKIA